MHLVWIPKYRKTILAGEVTVRVPDLLRQIAAEHELGDRVRDVREGRTGPRTPVCVLPTESTNQSNRAMAPGNQLTGIAAGVSTPVKEVLGQALVGSWRLAVSCGTITDEMIREYIDEQEGEQIADDGRFPIDNG